MAENAARPQASNGARAGYARSRDTRARILEAALAEAGEVGFHKTSVAHIATRAGVALGNVNYHFGSKRELLRELMTSLVTDLRSRIHVSVSADSDNFFTQQRAGLIAYLEYLQDNPAYARLADEVKLHEPEMYRLAVDGWIEQFAERVRGGVERGALRAMDEGEIQVHAHLVFGATQFLDRLMETEPYPGHEAVADAYLGMLQRGLGATP